MDKIFETWKEKGVTMIAVRCGQSSIHILDENGNNYGGFLDVENYKHLKKSRLEKLIPATKPIGKAELIVFPL
jgi:hypothetical protein